MSGCARIASTARRTPYRSSFSNSRARTPLGTSHSQLVNMSADSNITSSASSSSSASWRNASASAEVNCPDSADSAISPITGNTSATRGFKVSACLFANSVAAFHTSPSEPSTVSGTIVSA